MIHPTAVVETNAIGRNVTIKEYAVIRPNVELGEGVVIHPFVTLEEGVCVGDGVEIFPGSYIGKTPKGAGATARPIRYEATVAIGRECAVGPNAVIYYDVEVGNNCLIGDGASIREGCRIGARCIIGRYVTVNYATLIGNDVKIMDHSWLAGNMSVGNDVFMSGGVLTTNDNDMGLKGYAEGRVVGPTIENGVRIGVGALLLPNTTVGEHAVVAAGAIVTRNVAARDLMMGVPARVVRKVGER